jgi:drug/metabolite transporter (DMT)-like permease
MELALLGIIFNLLGSISTALGWAIQKKVHNDLKDTGVFYMTKKTWWLGILMVLSSQPLYLVAVSMTKVSILGVVGPFGMLANILLASLFLKERIRLWEYLGMSMFIPGTILTLCFSSFENRRYNRGEFNELFYSTQSIIYLVVS